LPKNKEILSFDEFFSTIKNFIKIKILCSVLESEKVEKWFWEVFVWFFFGAKSCQKIPFSLVF